MRQGTTPTHTFTFPFDTAIIKDLSIVYQQNGENIIKKKLSDCKVDGNSVSITLSQEETLMFNLESIVRVQVKVLTQGNDVLVSDIISRRAYECLDKEVFE